MVTYAKKQRCRMSHEACCREALSPRFAPTSEIRVGSRGRSAVASHPLQAGQRATVPGAKPRGTSNQSRWHALTTCAAAIGLSLLVALGCTKNEQASEHEGRTNRPRPQHSGGRQGGPPTGGERAAAVPVEVATVERATISSFIETNGTLEAENEVEIVARTSGPLTELRVEEGDQVRRGETLARIDEKEIRAQVEIARVALEEAEVAYERAVQLREERLISPEEYETIETRYQTAKAQLEGAQIQLGYTRILAPFGGLITERHVQFAEQVSPSTPLFHLSDFDPLLCPVQVPERDLGRLAIGQTAYLTVEAWPGERFTARVLRIRPVVEAETGTVKVTLEVEARDQLRPGMFARVYLQTETRENSLVIPKSALSLESIGDTVYVFAEGAAERRDVTLGFQEGDRVEVTAGLQAGERVVTVGQDGLSDGTPIQLLNHANGDSPATLAEAGNESAADRPRRGPPPGVDPAELTPERIEQMKERMRARGLSDEEIEERLRRIREGGGGGPR